MESCKLASLDIRLKDIKFPGENLSKASQKYKLKGRGGQLERNDESNCRACRYGSIGQIDVTMSFQVPAFP